MIAAIQAGGRSSRMGADKAWLDLNGRPLIEHVLHAAQPVATKLQIVINRAHPKRNQYEELSSRWSAELLDDVYDRCGPLGGIITVLQQTNKPEPVLMLACDLPFLTTDFLQLLQKIAAQKNGDLTVPCDALQRPQMLAAIYRQSCLPVALDLLQQRDFKVRKIAARVHTRYVLLPEYRHLPQAQTFLTNLNTPDEYKKALDNQSFN